MTAVDTSLASTPPAPPTSTAKSTAAPSPYTRLAQYLQHHWQRYRSQPLPLNIRCGRRQERLTILIEHAANLNLDAAETLTVLDHGLDHLEPDLIESLRTLVLPSLAHLNVLQSDPLMVEIYLRFQGEKRPYAGRRCWLMQATQPDLSLGYSYDDDDISSDTLRTAAMPAADPYGEAQTTSAEAHGADAHGIETDAANIQGDNDQTWRERQTWLDNPLTPWLLTGVGVCVAAFVGTYAIVSQPCLGAPCTPLTEAEQQGSRAMQALPNAEDWEDVKQVEQELEAAIAELDRVPRWSRSHRSSEALQTEYQAFLTQLEPIHDAFTEAVAAVQVTQNLPVPAETWWEAQNHWQKAIVQLAAIATDHPAYSLAQNKIEQYQIYLDSVKESLRTEQQALRILENAEAAVKLARLQEQQANTIEDWKAAEIHWLTAIQALEEVGAQTTSYELAQTRLQEYRGQINAIGELETKEQFAENLYNQALQSAEAAQAAELTQDWQAATQKWQLALNGLRKVPQGTAYHSQAQTLLQQYNQSFQAASFQYKGQDAVANAQTELSQACAGQPAVCSFRVTPSLIVVQLTFEYEQAMLTAGTLGNLQQQQAAVQELEQLEAKLTSISDRTTLPLELYDPDGSLVGAYVPGA